MTKINRTIKYSAFITESRALDIVKSEPYQDAVVNKDGLVIRGTGDTTLMSLTLLGKFAEGLHEYIRNGHLNTVVLLRINKQGLRELGSLYITNGSITAYEEFNRLGKSVIEFCPGHVKDKLGITYSVYRDAEGAPILDIYTTKAVVNEYKPNLIELLGGISV